MNRLITDRQKNENSGGGLRRLLRESLIVSLLLRFCDAVGELAKTCFAAGLLTRYPEGELSDSDGLASGLIEKSGVRTGLLLPFFRACGRAFSGSVLLRALQRSGRWLLELPVSFYGTVYVSYGLFRCLTALLSRYLMSSGASVLSAVGAGAAIMLCSSVLFFSQTPLIEALGNGLVTGFLLTDVFGFRRESLVCGKEHRPKGPVGILIGLAAALLALRVSPWFLTFLPVFAGAFAMILLSPEVGLLLLFALFPFLTTMRTAALLLLTLFSFFCKVLQGKRTVRFEALDLAVFGFQLLVFLGGFVSASPEASLRPALLMTALISGYFLTVNLLRTPQQIRGAVGLTAASAVVVSAAGVLEHFLGLASPEWLDRALFPDITGRVVSTFGNPNVLGIYLIMVIPFLALPLLTGKTPLGRASGVLLAAIGVSCLILTWSRGAWLGFLIGGAFLLLIYSKKSLIFLLFGTVTVPFLFGFLPDSITGRFLSIGNLADTSTNYRVAIWKNCADMLSDWWYSGIGTGSPVFREIFPIYSGRVPAEHAHSLYLEILLEHGVFGFLLFALVLFLTAQVFFTGHRKKDDGAGGMLNAASVAAFSGIAAVLVQGTVEHVWYNYRIFCFFWLLTALTAACRRVSAASRTEVRYEGTYLNIPFIERKRKKHE